TRHESVIPRTGESPMSAAAPQSTLTNSPAHDRADDIERLQIAIIQTARQIRLIHKGGPYKTALAAVVKYGPLRMSDLAAREGVDPASTSRTVRSLEEQGLVVRRPDSRDARASLIEITEEGNRVFLERRRGVTNHLVRELSGLSYADLDRLLSVTTELERLAALTELAPSETRDDDR
ncbi:MAG: MarR family transcriptional regulator, partial [Rhodococcus sp. (in: high G+C Gram-positive bacteria)]|uniref:MarR family winged helix-turn-helix transcriptional regulator n=1 Tax=Rhodococcus sp. TaxID=1831 RepID=UPI003BB07150